MLITKHSQNMNVGRMWKLFMIADTPLDSKDAQSTHVIEIFNNLTEYINVYLFIPRPKRKMMVSKSKNIITVPIPLQIKVLSDIIYQILLFFYLFYYSLKLSPNIIYVRFSEFSIAPVFISKILNIPLIIEVNGLIVDEIKVRNKQQKLYINIYIKIVKIVEKFNYIFAQKIITVTSGIRDYIRKSYQIPNEKLIVINNGANINLLKPININKVRKRLKMDFNTNYVCFVGSLVPWQGVEYLTLSAPLILKEFPNTKFLIVGDGRMKEKLIELVEKMKVSDKFIFTGAVPYEKVPLYINASDICVVYKKPLKSGYSPLKLYEYMACGKPIVASRVEGFEILEQNNAGILVEPGNPEKLAKAIIKLLKDEKLRKRMGKNGRKYVVKNHSWEAVAKKVAKVCEEVLNS